LFPRGCKFKISGAFAKEDVMAALYALLKAKPLQKLHHSREGDIRVGVSS